MNLKNEIIFEKLLYPHRSLSVIGFTFIMLFVILVSSAVGLFFFLLGAWPVIGFFGLDIILIYLAFKISFNSGKKSEKIILTENELIIEKQKIFGKKKIWSFRPPHWVKVMIKQNSTSSNRLVLYSHGLAIFIGDFLSDNEKIETANIIKNALKKLKI